MDQFFNILFENPVGKTLFVNETEIAVLGHQMKGNVIEHEYFGEIIVEDLD
jgi:hypothetical protein